MDNYLTALVETFDPAPHFQTPEVYETAWGPAVRSVEVGRLYWSPDLYVRHVSINKGLLMLLPRHYQTLPWVALNIDGPGLKMFEQLVNRQTDPDAETPDDPDAVNEHRFLRLVRHLLRGQSRWAFCLEAHEDEISQVLAQTETELIAAIVEAYRWDSIAPPGFLGYLFCQRSAVGGGS